MSLLNLGIVAHVDAGKTSLTERLLYEAGVTDALGSVDAGTTRTDSMELERRRGITIRAAVTSFALGDLAVNIVDTPGHPDFIAEVERSLTILDAAVLVLSSVEGVQPQTVVIWRALQRIGVPTILFINKVDRSGSDVARVIGAIRHRLTSAAVSLARVDGEGTPDACVRAIPLSDESVVQTVAGADDRVLQRWAEGTLVTDGDILSALRRGLVTPVTCGSAITGAGIDQLRAMLVDVAPRAPSRTTAPAGTVFAVDRDTRGRRTWIRMWDGPIRVRDRIALPGRRPERITEIAVSRPGGPCASASARGGEIAVLRGLSGARVGDTIGRAPARRTHRFAPATMQALVEPIDPTQRTALYAGLSELADEDPLIDLHLDETDGEAAVRLHGDVQKEVIAALLLERYGVAARFLATSVVCIERVGGVGEALEQVNVDGNPYLATIGLRVEPAEIGHGIEFSPGIERGNLPTAFIAATEEGVRAALRHGLQGWAVTDGVVTMTASGYCPRQSHRHQKFNKAISSVGADFRNLAQVVVMTALQRARTVVCQPIDRFDLDLPVDALGNVSALLGRLGALTTDSTATPGYTRLTGTIPAGRVPELAARLPDLSGGEAVLVTDLAHHAPVSSGSPIPSRPRPGVDPRDRELWFRAMPRGA